MGNIGGSSQLVRTAFIAAIVAISTWGLWLLVTVLDVLMAFSPGHLGDTRGLVGLVEVVYVVVSVFAGIVGISATITQRRGTTPAQLRAAYLLLGIASLGYPPLLLFLIAELACLALLRREFTKPRSRALLLILAALVSLLGWAAGYFYIDHASAAISDMTLTLGRELAASVVQFGEVVQIVFAAAAGILGLSAVVAGARRR